VAKGITDSEILLDFTQDGTIKTSQSAMGMSIDATATSKTTGTVTLDRASGIIKQRTATTNTQSTMNLGGREMNSTLKMTTVTTVKTL
jgi:bifunctional pyridoxal-dependent enzyme with beta-cystathionase and maltose regulon repressor activities